MDAQSNSLTSLSAGLLIYDVLSKDTGVKAVSNKVFPVVSEDGATLPYICYRRGGSDSLAVKNLAGADTITVEVLCYSSDYAGGVRMAEAVRAALDGAQATYSSTEGSLVARSIRLIDSEEGFQDDAYVQALTFSMKI